ncbi:MAG: electron transfer flavoprotein subunit alpha/FixB family protein [Bacteroidales bacterium]|nr:electron transfer flavoprotein subunit alpha/FixB family protein [Bacteroidales bacterium]
MNNIFVYCEITEEGTIADVSLELCSKARKLADTLQTKLEAIVIGSNLQNLEAQLYPYGVDIINVADDSRLFPYSTLPHFDIVTNLFKEKQPEIALFGATSVGRDLAPRISSYLRCGLTADCTSLEIGEHSDAKSGKEYKNLLYQIRPAFGGNIIATIVNPETRPQMATVREGVMKKEVYNATHKGVVNKLDVEKYVTESDFCVKILERHIEEQKINIKNAQIIVAGGYGVGSKENFKMLHELAELIGGEVGATRAAVDAGYTEGERQIGQTGVTVRPKLYVACGISGAVQHRAGMDQSAKIISINTDPKAPINSIADYTIIGDVCDVLAKMIKTYKANTK